MDWHKTQLGYSGGVSGFYQFPPPPTKPADPSGGSGKNKPGGIVKTTIKLSTFKAIVIQPCVAGGVAFAFSFMGIEGGGFTLCTSNARYAAIKIKAAIDKGEHSEIHLFNGNVVQIGPAISGIGAELHCSGLGSIDLTPDQCGVLIVAIECAINPVVAAKHAAKAAA